MTQFTNQNVCRPKVFFPVEININIIIPFQPQKHGTYLLFLLSIFTILNGFSDKKYRMKLWLERKRHEFWPCTWYTLATRKHWAIWVCVLRTACAFLIPPHMSLLWVQSLSSRESWQPHILWVCLWQLWSFWDVQTSGQNGRTHTVMGKHSLLYRLVCSSVSFQPKHVWCKVVYCVFLSNHL